MMFAFYLFLLYFPIMSNGNPLLCTEVSVTYNSTYYSDTYLLASATIMLYQSNTNLQYFSVSNITGMDMYDKSPIDSICYPSGGLVDCNQNLTNSYNFTLDAFFTTETPCNVNYFEDIYSTKNQTTCCTKFIPAPIVAPSNATTRCKRFHSRVNLLNDDYTIYATTSMNYILQGNQIITHGDYTINESLYPEYFFNENGETCFSHTYPQLTCDITLPNGDSKNFIRLYFFGNDTTEFKVPQVGSFIIRNNETLMYEGIPFNPKNDCQYYSNPISWYSEKMSHSEFCCKEFE